MAKEPTEEPTDLGSQDVENLFKERQNDRVALLQESIKDIQQMLEEREHVHSDLLKQLAKLENTINNQLNQLDLNRADDKPLATELLKKKVEVEELRLKENLDVWRDKALLKKELREHMKEFRDMESKTSMLGNLLEL